MKYELLKNLIQLKQMKLILGIFIVCFLPFNNSSFSKSKNLTYEKARPKSEKIYTTLNEYISSFYISNAKWEILDETKTKEIDKSIIWKKYDFSEENEFKNYSTKVKTYSPQNTYSLSTLNRSIVFNNSEIGPDVSWLVPPGFSWSKNHRIDFSARGHNRRKEGEPFFGWNGGDAVGQISYQPIHFDKSSLGINLGFRSLYSGKGAIGGESSIGEGLSMGFRADKELSRSSGIAFGAEQLIHFDGKTDTGRDIYFTISKGKWSQSVPGNFPLTIATVGVATGKMAEGNIKFFCSDLFGGSGTEVAHQRSLCWSPVFSIAKVYNKQFSTFFEYNSKWFLLGTSVVPLKNKPLRGSFAIQLSDHIDNYKVNDFNELKWVFRLSVGF
tara:strand:- start:434 stop:1585 length:1152 start_codon:yes stop_codon:yes gene_type:complete